MKAVNKYFEEHKLAAVLVSLVSACVLSFLFQILIEYVRLEDFAKVVAYVKLRSKRMGYSWPVLVCIFAALTVCTRRPAVGAGVLGTLLFAAALANANKLLYRSEPLLPKDLTIIREGLAIAGELELLVSVQAVIFLAVVALSTVLLLPVKLPKLNVKHAKSVQAALAVFFVLTGGVYTRAYLHNRATMSTLGIGNAIIGKARSYERSSFVTAFLYDVSSLIVSAPDGYSRETMNEIANLLPETGGASTPDIIIIMSESYYHLEDITPYTYSEDLTANFDLLARQGLSGYHLSTGYGGGTANIEFSMLTGNMIECLPYGSTPFNEYLYENYPAYPGFLYANGYQTAAIHSYDRFFYNRENAYKDLMFEAAYFMNDFVNAVKVNKYISDQSTMEEIVKQYEALRAESDAPVFIHTVTMQNHVEYEAGTYADGYRVEISNTGSLNEQQIGTIETVATNLRDIDRALGYLTNYLATLDRDVVLLFFGDHQTGIKVNGKNMVTESSMFLGMSEREEMLATHRTPYLMWANFEAGASTLAGMRGDEGKVNEIAQPEIMSAAMLLPMFTQRYGLLQPTYFAWLYEQSELLSGNILGWALSPTGNVSAGMTTAQQAIYDTWQMIQYDLMFGEGYLREQLF